MNCSKHPDLPAAGVCSFSGKPYCQEELVEVYGKLVAEDNLEKFIEEQSRLQGLEPGKNSSPIVFMNAGGGGVASSSSSSAASAAARGSFFSRISCADWILVLLTGGLWLIVVFIKSMR